MLILTTSIVDCRDTQLIMPRSTIQWDTTWVSDASTYELMPHPRYQNPYNYNAQQLQQSTTQNQQVQVQGTQS
jgi:hypothetical protein